ncbi:alpha/beta family hydrolase [Candidatus Colwellia aromaticivorans]|uniref:alpha/beta family hydrolase n=1 Tax=Candidatus Colwellia aromaticivorans TaxID=2267621 RepID=UPI000DF46C61|nr:alpha/beta family hydrolase [Candidatus Colwellia aromaticivorans]
MENIIISKIENTVDNPIAQIIFAHGAGADMHHEFMEKVSVLLNKANINVVRFNFPYMDKRIALGKRYPPDRMPKLIDCYKRVIDDFSVADSQQAMLPLFIGGKSMGSRVAATIAADDDIAMLIQGVFCIGYPFHPTKKPEKLRLEPLQNTQRTVLILQGDRDTLGSQVEIEQYEVSPLCHTIFLPDGDHSLKPRVKSGYTHQQHIETAVNAIVTFIKEESAND